VLQGHVVDDHHRLLHGDVRSWSPDDVIKFVAMVPGCSEYAEVTTPADPSFVLTNYSLRLYGRRMV